MKIDMDIPPQTCWFIKDYGIFGTYPYYIMDQLQKLDIDLFVDLTCDDEELKQYKSLLKPNQEYLHFPIIDRRVPSDTKKTQALVDKIISYLTAGKRVYIHCRGGHGRSGVIVALIYIKLYKYQPEFALKLTHFCHQQRKEMSDKMRKLGSPQTKSQKRYVLNFKW